MAAAAAGVRALQRPGSSWPSAREKKVGAGGNKSADELEGAQNTERPGSDGTNVFIGIKSVAVLHV